MKRRALIQAGLGLCSLTSLSSYAASRLHWQTTVFHGLGTTLSIRAAHHDVQKLDAALSAARSVVAHVEDQMSLFRPQSAINQLNREGELLHPDASLVHVLQLSQRISQQSRGAFDVTVQPLWALYDNAKKQGRLPTANEVQAARQHVSWQQLQISPQRIAFNKPGMGITLNGIAQGYASDLVRAQLQGFGVAHALINTGEWSGIGESETQRDWVLGVADPHDVSHIMARLRMRGRCVATSADDQCTFSSDRKHHHIFDPSTGYSPSDISSVTVFAKTCAHADALTKVLFVSGYAHALRLASAWQVEAWVVHKDGRWKASPELSRQVAS